MKANIPLQCEKLMERFYQAAFVQRDAAAASSLLSTSFIAKILIKRGGIIYGEVSDFITSLPSIEDTKVRHCRYPYCFTEIKWPHSTRILTFDYDFTRDAGVLKIAKITQWLF